MRRTKPSEGAPASEDGVASKERTAVNPRAPIQNPRTSDGGVGTQVGRRLVESEVQGSELLGRSGIPPIGRSDVLDIRATGR
jgi:hypothetical protein